MPSVQYFKHFVNERLIVAAEEIFKVFEETIVEYEEEISRQKKLLDIALNPEVKLHRIAFSQQHDWRKEQDQRIDTQERGLCVDCTQEGSRSPCVDQEDLISSQIKKEQEEPSISLDRDQFVQKQDNDAFMFSVTYEEGIHNEDQTPYLNLDVTQSTSENESVDNISVKSFQVPPEQNTDDQLLSSYHPYLVENQDYRDQHTHGGSELTGNIETNAQNQTNTMHSNSIITSTMLKLAHTHKRNFKCETCGKILMQKSKLIRHQRIHSGERPFSCNMCESRFKDASSLKRHMRAHTGERPYLCNICGRRFFQLPHLQSHTRIHTGEKPYFCKICGKEFRSLSGVTVHMRTHACKRPYQCDICGKGFLVAFRLAKHMTLHTGK